MGWLFKPGSTRRGLIAERTQDWQQASIEMLIDSKCLARCFRGGRFSGVLWSVWGWTFTKDGQEVEPRHRWIQFGGNEEWRVGVRSYHQRAKEKRIANRLQKAGHKS